MYIEKEILTHYGIPSTHHVLKEIHIYYNMGVAHIDVAGYFSKDAYDSGADAVVVNQIEVGKTAFDGEKDIYDAILSSHVFQDGILYEDMSVNVESNEEKTEEETETAQN